ncbi:MAG: hypothetical protein ABH807_01490, partial [Candidatus Shapirobacteria bacterium]
TSSDCSSLTSAPLKKQSVKNWFHNNYSKSFSRNTIILWKLHKNGIITHISNLINYMIPEQQIWGNMIRVSNRGFLRWNENIALKTGGDPREYPERYMAMCGNLRKLEDHNPTLDTDDITELSPNHFVANQGEITGVNGLLRLIDRFPINIRQPKEVLVVGAISPNSLLSVLAWCRKKNWQNTHVTLVDKSPVPITTLQHMQNGGYFNWSGGVDLLEENILGYTPKTQPQIVIGDILNMWMVDAYQYPNLDRKSPYEQYKKFLYWGANTVGNEGWFLSRCMIAPSKQRNIDPNLRFQQESKDRADRIVTQLGSFAQQASHNAIEEMVEELFEDPPLTTFCGLYKVSKTYRSSRPNAGNQAIEVFRRFHKRNFPITYEVRVDDPKSGFSFLNFACGFNE